MLEPNLERIEPYISVGVLAGPVDFAGFVPANLLREGQIYRKIPWCIKMLISLQVDNHMQSVHSESWQKRAQSYDLQISVCPICC
jgi:hypothetical protein